MKHSILTDHHLHTRHSLFSRSDLVCPRPGCAIRKNVLYMYMHSSNSRRTLAQWRERHALKRHYPWIFTRRKPDVNGAAELILLAQNSALFEARNLVLR
jgi:hypothetical protein